MTRRQHPVRRPPEGSGTSVLWQPSVPQTSHDSYGMSDNAAVVVSLTHLCGDGGFLPPPSLISLSLAAVAGSTKKKINSSNCFDTRSVATIYSKTCLKQPQKIDKTQMVA